MNSNGSVKPEFQKTQYPKDNGWGRLWPNRQKTNPNQPDKTGNLEVMGEPLKVSIWVNPDGSENMKTRQMTDEEREKYYAKKEEMKARREAQANQNTAEIRKNIEPVKPSTPMPDPNIDDEIPF